MAILKTLTNVKISCMKTLLVSFVPCLFIIVALYAYTKNLKTPANPITTPPPAAVTNEPAAAITPVASQSDSLVTNSQVNDSGSKEENLVTQSTAILTSDISSTNLKVNLHAYSRPLLEHAKINATEYQGYPKKSNATDSMTWASIPEDDKH